MIKPFEIIETRDEGQYGTGVSFKVSTRFAVDEPGFKGERTLTQSSGILVPFGEDIDNYILEHLKRSKWISE